MAHKYPKNQRLWKTDLKEEETPTRLMTPRESIKNIVRGIDKKIVSRILVIGFLSFNMHSYFFIKSTLSTCSA
jgi:hypothetical protein